MKVSKVVYASSNLAGGPKYNSFSIKMLTVLLSNHNYTLMLQLNVTECPQRCSCSSISAVRKYFLHLGHSAFSHVTTGAVLEAPLNCLIESVTLLRYPLKAHKSFYSLEQ